MAFYDGVCDRCNGDGEIYTSYEGGCGCGADPKCPKCGGSGCGEAWVDCPDCEGTGNYNGEE